MTPRFEEVDPARSKELFYRTPYTQMIGARLRRLRLNRGLSQGEALRQARRPSGGV